MTYSDAEAWSNLHMRIQASGLKDEFEEALAGGVGDETDEQWDETTDEHEPRERAPQGTVAAEEHQLSAEASGQRTTASTRAAAPIITR